MDILLFDNDASFAMELCNKINNILIKERFDNDFVKLYHNADSLLKDITLKNKVRLFLIGINFKYTFNNKICDGLWLAYKIREIDYISPIVFFSNHVEIALSIFDYKLEVMDFISKYDTDIIEKRMKDCIQITHKRYLRKIDYQENFFNVYKDFELLRIPFSNIIYFETCTIPHKIKLVTREHEIELYRSLKSIVDLDQRLFRIHKSFIINKEHILSMNVKEKYVKMSNGDKCPISDKTLQVVKKEFKIKKY
ncbi:response regulator [Clostridioides phage phiSemix9P1]|uniref:LytR/AlgR family response regulator transcription factor n=1 Tax=unclassified Clostridioides TaxID=2635829 RepID=UPI0009C28A8B|nr:response regulator [Clostridioides phage phiSemix9P1]MCC0646162.1 response regulator transcription factor [Clostridioides sp. ZZV14-6150]MCC0718329.1 response regulator transcription factor [Clostridioides sp. ZZV14-6105]MCC0723980.1 response regulator transcription factor [Clostridioides sp. ZZV14-6104]MCC0724816.1 response regulator transcription factor [Clostridioides sp. ZZV14-6045]MCC0732262.1 response regulator transcription factor [Clostridioides sp. ZZV14-6048]MCC0736399.1 response